jgi:hypothetical protein
MKRFFILHPYLFVLGSLLFVYPFTSVVAAPVQIIRPLLIYWGVLVLLTYPVKWIVRDQHWAAILLTVLAVGIFATELFFYTVIAISVVVILLWLLISTLRKRTVRLAQVTILLNTISIILAFLFLFRIFPLIGKIPLGNYQRLYSYSNTDPIAQITYDGSKPDIYYIVLDGYTRSDILRDLYQYDNSEFLDELDARGFIIPAESRSNYPKTALSVTSTLNMNYIGRIAPGLEDSFFWWLMTPLSNHNQVRRIMEDAGYHSVSVASDWGTTNNPTADYYFKPHPVHLNDFEGYILAKTPIGVLRSTLSRVAYVPSFSGHRQLVDYEYSALSNIPTIEGPKFVFSHIISPHPPFVFDSQGNPVDPDYPFSFNDANDFPGTNAQYREGYIDQVQYVNARILQVVDDILAKSKTPPIIVLQGDHGSGLLTDFSSSENTCIRERFSVFAAYHLPGVEREQVPDEISAVNVFRLILNLYFDTNLPLLEDEYYYYKDTIYIYRAEDISSRLDEPCKLHP